jgi:hypothetical protein
MRRLDEVGSYISDFCREEPGVYRLIGLAESGANIPAILDRLCGQDETGTLYIGMEGQNLAVQSRLQKLIRSVREPNGNQYNREHIGDRLRSHPWLSQRFPESKLAVAWSYTVYRHAYVTEQNLRKNYFESFGDNPPLNRK